MQTEWKYKIDYKEKLEKFCKQGIINQIFEPANLDSLKF